MDIRAWGNSRETLSFRSWPRYVRASREKRKDVSGQNKLAEDAMHSVPDQTGDLLLPFWSRDPLVQSSRKLQRSAKRKSNGMLGVVSCVILRSNCSWRLEKVTFIFVKSGANATFSAFPLPRFRANRRVYHCMCKIIRKSLKKHRWVILSRLWAWLPWESTCVWIVVDRKMHTVD